ncbi:MAG: hypothetical protein EP332_08330 [Bacteroidetes bacterium]|nr:MAG: hypothetical protein EP332_08330 [Bacteroidota bacterium]
MKKVLILAAAALMAMPVSAQSKGKKSVWPNNDAKRWQLGLQAGATTYSGDARDFGFSYVAGLNVQYNFSHTLGVRLLGNYGQLKGAEDPTDRPYSQFDFTNNFWEVQPQLTLTMGNISFLRKARKLNFFVGAGYGIQGNDLTSEFIETKDTSATLQTGSFSDMTFAVSGSAGFRYNISQSMSLGLEYNIRYHFSDLVDGIQYASFGNQAKDVSHYVQVGLQFKLGKKGKEHVEWINPVEAIYEDIAKVEKKVEALSGDQDGDGVSDYFDQDNTTPAGANVYGNGKAVDTDGDGVPDVLDEEPNSPKGAEVDEKGRAADADGDGVPDVLDLSPNTDTSYMVNHQGIPIMTKELSRKLAPKGGLSTGGLGFMPAILFETGSSTIKPTHYVDLQGIAEAIKRSAGVKILIIGNADYRGSEKRNEQLALSRAEAVKKVLVESFGVDANSIEVQSNGEKVPIAKGTDAVSLQANRRVQFFVVE